MWGGFGEAPKFPTPHHLLFLLWYAQAEDAPEALVMVEHTLDAMARALYVEPGLWPLTVLTDGQTAYYGHAGYAVGTIPLALNLVQALGGETKH